MEIEAALKLVGAVPVIAGALFALRKMYQWVYPIKITPAIHFPRPGLKRGAISAEVINRSNEPVFIVRCEAVGIHSRIHIISSLIRRPFTHPRLYKAIRFGVMRFQLIGEEVQKLEPFELKRFEHKLSDLPLSFFSTNDFLIEVTLSTGRIIRSRRMMVPRMWKWQEKRRVVARKNA